MPSFADMLPGNMARRQMWVWKFVVGAAVLLVGGIGVNRCVNPPRPMFHHAFSPWGDRGPAAFWATPPATRTDTQEMHADFEHNLLVVLDHGASTYSGWGGAAMFGVHRTIFRVGQRQERVEAPERDLLIVVTPDEATRRSIAPGEAERVYRVVKEDLPDFNTGDLLARVYEELRIE